MHTFFGVDVDLASVNVLANLDGAWVPYLAMCYLLWLTGCAAGYLRGGTRKG
jgi:hypothetical protein